MTNFLSPRVGDPFEPYKALQTSLRIWQGLSCLLVVALSCTWAWGALGWSRPPVVITKDRIHGEPASVSVSGEIPPVTVADARVFFLNMVKLRFGWDSLTVQRDLGEFRKHCYKDHWLVEMQHFQEPVPIGEDPKQTMPRINWWVRQEVRNNLLMPQSLDEIDCVEKDEMFHCKMNASLVTQPLIPVPERSPVTQRVAFFGTLFKVKHRVETPYGLIVGEMRQLPYASKEREG